MYGPDDASHGSPPHNAANRDAGKPPADDQAIQRQLRQVAWHDLTGVTRAESIHELLGPLPWLLLSLGAYQWLGLLAGLPLSFVFFMAALRLNHEAIHRNLGISATGHKWVIGVLSGLMLGSNTGVEVNHLRHHAHCMDEDDVEGRCGRLSLWRVWLHGPVFPVVNHLSAWRQARPDQRRRIALELLLTVAALVLVVTSIAPRWLALHVIVMGIAQCCTAFFAVWITHRGCDPKGIFARSQRSRLINALTLNLFFHFEHHMFPRVPARRLDVLAARLDQSVPGIMRQVRRVV